MYPTYSKPGIFPQGRLHYLVLAACGAGDPQLAWDAYADALANDFPNEGELRLFPLIADRLGGDLRSQPLTKYLQSTQRWARMQAMVNRQMAGQIGRLFKAKNLDLMWTKGTAIIARTDGRPELRPSVDLDALFRWDDVEQILALGKAQGWAPRTVLHKNRKRARYRNTEISFDIGARGELDLQWLPRLAFAYDRKIQPWLWQDNTRAQDAHGTFYASDTWLMIETIDHGLNANSVYPIRWLVDAVRLLHWRQNSIDWEMLVEIVKRNKLHYSFLKGLETVARYSPHIPQNVLNALKKPRASHLDREEFKVRVSIDDPAARYVARRVLTRLRREPSRIYYKAPPNPLDLKLKISARAKLAIAVRNVGSRALFPLWYILPQRGP